MSPTLSGLRRLWPTAFPLLCLTASLLRAAPIVSEINYHPFHADLTPEPVTQEWIEIFNPEATPVDVSGWALTKGVAFTIPAGTVIPAAGYLVIAADVGAFQAAHPAFSGLLRGGWTGQLSNAGEKLKLEDAAGGEVDTVDYSDEGDWAIRGRGAVVSTWLGHQGWDWFTDADGVGKTKELVRTALRKNTGQNWKDSAVTGGTPGAANSVNATDVAPVILDGKHRPQVPRSIQAVVVSAKITDDNAAAVTATLRWRLDGAAIFSSLPMTDPDGDGEYSATIPAQANLTIVEWYIEATDGTFTRTWPPAARTSNPGVTPETYAQSCNALYQVDNTYLSSTPWTAGNMPVYRLIMTAAERTEIRNIQEGQDSSNIQIDAAMNATFIATDGTGQDTRYRASVRNRGFSSRSGPPSHFSLSLVSGEEWAGRQSFQLNCRYPHAAVCAANIFKLGGMAVQEAAAAQLRVNGLNPAVPGQGVGAFTQSITNGALARTEALGGDWASSHFPNDDGGNLYRVDDHATGGSGASNRFSYPGTTVPASYQDIYKKQTNADLNDYSDLAGLFQALNDNSASSAVFAANLRAKANVEQWLTFIALDSLVGNMEGGLTTGRSDDFSLYRGLIDQRFVFVPHDFDTVLGQNSPNGLNRSIFSPIDGSGGSTFTGLVRLFNEPEFLHFYYRKNVELCNTVFNNARLDPLFDEIMASWPAQSGSAISAPPIAAMKTWVGQRRTNVLNQIPQVNLFDVTGVSTTNATLIDGMKQTPDGAATFSGTFNVAAVQSVSLNGQPATLQWRTTTTPAATAGRWTFAATTANGFLKRGPNRVQAVFYSGMNGTGSVVYSASVDVYNAAGTPTSVNADGTVGIVLPGNIQLTAPATYIPGIPFLVGVEYRTAANDTDRTQWTKTVALTASNGVSLSSAGTGGGAANVTLYNGRGSLLVNAIGGATGAETVLLNGRNTTGSVTPAGATPATWTYYTGTAAPMADWQFPATVLTGWQTGTPVFYRGETGVTGTNITTTTVGWAMRTTFTVANPADYPSAKIRVQRDDGLLIWINGTFLTADGLLQTDSWTTPSTNAIATAAETQWVEFVLPVGSLVAGVNTIAIEVHNNNQSTDQRLNCEVTAVPVATGVTDPGNFTLTGAVDGLTANRSLTSLGLTPAKTAKSGTLAGDETWSGVIDLTGDVQVPSGVTLTIAAGTHVLAAGVSPGQNGGSGIEVDGSLVVSGSQASPVSMTSADPAKRCASIHVTGPVATANATWLLFSHGGASADGTGMALRASNAATLTLGDSILSDSHGVLLGGSAASAIAVQRSQFSRCVKGVAVDNGGCSLTNCLVSDALPAHRVGGTAGGEDGAHFLSLSPAATLSCTGTTVAACGDDAMELAGVASCTLSDCIFRNAGDSGVEAEGSTFTVAKTQIVDCDRGLAYSSAPASNCAVTLRESTLYAVPNPANAGSAVHGVGIHHSAAGGATTPSSTLTVRDGIVSADIPFVNAFGAPGNLFPLMQVDYSCTHDLAGAADSVPSGTGNIAMDPQYSGAPARNLRIGSASPCRDTGDPALTDADGSRIDMGALPYSGGSTPTNILWPLSGSPYRVSQNTTIAAGTTLTVEPGVNVYFDQNMRLTVRGRMLAVGTATNRIRFSHVPGTSLATDVDPIKNGTQTGAPKWGGIRVFDSLAQENQFRYCDFVNAQGTDPQSAENQGSLGFIRSQGWADHLTFAGTHLRMLYGRNCSLTVTHCNFPDMFLFDSALGRIENPTDFLSTADNRMEPLKVEHPTTDTELAGQTGAGGAFPNGLPRHGHWRVYYNDFHGNRGHQDVFDADSGRWDVPDANGNQVNGQFMLDCRYNTFWGLTGDEHIDLGGDAFIASNRFYSGSKDQWTIDTGYANAISSGDKGSGTTIVVARNVFFDLDHAINCKINTATIFEHNTCVDFHQDWSYNHTVTQDVRGAAVNLYVPNDGNAAGDGAYIAYNIFYGNSVAPDDTVNPDPVGGFPRVISWPDVTTTGAKTSVIRVENNFVDDRILDTNIGTNHPGGLFASAYGFGNVQGNPLFTDKAARDFSLAPDSPAKGRAAGGLDFGASVSEWCYLLNVPPSQTAGTSATISVGGPGIVAYKWRMDGGAWSNRIQIGDGGVMSRTGSIVRQGTISLTGLANGTHTLEVLGQDMAGNWQDADPARTIEGLAQSGPSVATWTVDTASPLVRIEEIAANTADDNDWIEFYNAGASAVDLTGWYLAEDAVGTNGVALSGGSIVPAGGRLLVNSTALGFSMDKDGDSVVLLDPSFVLKDALSFGPQPQGYTLGRVGLTGGWTLCLPTAGAANAAAPLATSTATLRISEVFASPVISYKADWIELTNSGALPVSLTGLVLSDNRLGTAGSIIPPYSYVGPGASAVFLADGTAPPVGNHVSFGLNSQQGSVALLAADGVSVLDEIALFPQTDDWSQTRLASGGAAWSELATRGFSMATTDAAYLNALSILRGLRITEIMYNAQGGSSYDWIELRNVGVPTFNLAGVSFDRGIGFTFGNVTLSAGQNIVLCKDIASFQSRYGAAPNIGGAYSGNLDNGGETLALRLAPPFDENVLCFSYNDAWYPNTDGLGKSLDLASTTTARADYGDSTSWLESTATGGSPDNTLISTPTTYAQWLSFFATVDGADADRDGLSSVVEYGLGLNPQSPQFGNGAAGAPSGAVSGDGRLQMTFNLPVNAARPDGYGQNEITYLVQVSDDLGAGWTTIATKTPTAGWVGAGSVVAGAAAGGFVPVAVADTVTIAAGSRRFIRLAVSWTP